MQSVIEYFRIIEQKLSQEKALGDSNHLAKILFEDLCGIKNISDSENIELDQSQRIDQAVERVLRGEPIQYVTGIAHFYGYEFEVDPQVLIPRPETEELVFTAISWINSLDEKPIEILDIGTGSGCIAIVLKRKLPGASVVAVDISHAALDLARRNARKSGVEILFREVDFSDPLRTNQLGIFDLIISNPPYIGEKERELLSQQVLFEPPMALFPPQGDVQFFYRQIFQFCGEHLAPDGCLLVELNEFQAEDTLKIARNYNCLRDLEIIKDMQGKKRILRAFRSIR